MTTSESAGGAARRPAAAVTASLSFGIAIVVVSFNLRPAVASPGAVLGALRHSLGLSSVGAAALTAAPVFCFGALAMLGPWLARRVGLRRAVLLLSVAILIGLVVRIGPDTATLFVGTLIAAGGIAAANVLMPVIINRDFPTSKGLMMGLYTTAVVGSAAAGAGLTVPIGNSIGHDWRGGLGIWAVAAAIGVALWLPHVRADRLPPADAVHVPSRMRHDRLAWIITGFFGLQSLSFYAVLSWLPSLYQDHGYSAATAGGLMSLSAVLQVPPALVLPALATRMRHQQSLVLGAVGLTAVGLTGILVAPTTVAALWVIMLGLGQGAAFSVAVTMLVLRTQNPTATSQLSAMAQSVGYLIACLGPLLVGALHAATGGWHVPLVLLLALLVPEALTGLRAAAPGYVQATATP